MAELVDLEQELSSLRRGLTQVEGLTPSSDPFGDSFIVPSQVSSSVDDHKCRLKTVKPVIDLEINFLVRLVEILFLLFYTVGLLCYV